MDRQNGLQSDKRTVSECSNDSDGWADVPEELLEQEIVSCIFTGKTYKSAQEYFVYLKDNMDLNIWQIVLSDLNLDFFGFVKLINYMRKHYSGKAPPSLDELTLARDSWGNDEYLKPVVVDDPLLQFMIVNDEDDDESDVEEIEQLALKKFSEKDDGDDVKSPEMLLQKEREINKNLHENLDRALKQIDEMKKFMHNVILTGNRDITRSVSACRQTGEITVDEEEFEDSGYYGTYSHHEIHAEMLQDTVRTMSYKNAVLSNKNVFKDKVVLDVGCGTCILSMFCAEAGAKHVYAVDMSDMAYQAIDIVRQNGFENKITVYKSTAEEVELPVEKVDIIISEWMGYFLLYESMFDSVLFARNKWLQPNGLMLPTNCGINILAGHDEQMYNQRINFWTNVYGYKMTSLRKQVVSEGYVMNAKATSVISEPCQVFIMDAKNIGKNQLDFKSNFELKILKTGLLSCIIGYFDCYFNIEKQVMFSTSPCHQLTHWKQTVFFLNKPLEVKEGDILPGSMDCHKNPKDPRSLIVKLKLLNEEQIFKVE